MKVGLLTAMFFLLFSSMLFAEGTGKKTANASRAQFKPSIDGRLDESIWEQAQVLTDFIQLEPNTGKPSEKTTRVRVLYDDDALYIGASMTSDPKTILKELSQRDQIGNADWFAFLIDAYKDGNNGLGFIVTASGVQMDVKYSVFGEDESWNAVWQSAVHIGDDGWSAEMKIPYSALRFPNQEVQQWHVNFLRYIRSTREKSSWNEVNPAVNGFLNQSGYLDGIRGIEPPVRLQLSPYLSSYYTIRGNQKATSINGGMDVKYGINDAFTLDMTLIPDFGQVQSDNQVLNLSPFEVRFQENRQFFTEGTELFSKGDLFYSRRIGTTNPSPQLNPGERFLEEPNETRLLNATKLSGRTKKGTGLGFFNAVTNNNFIQAGTENTSRKAIYEPLTNYNVMVVDQNLKHNSYVTLINTNVTRSGSAYDANVTGMELYLQNKSLKYALGGSGALSQQLGLNGRDVIGQKHGLRLLKVSGNFLAGIGYDTKTDTYDPNDLGFLLFNNTIDKFLNLGYQIYKPFWKFNRVGVNFNAIHTSLYKPRVFNNFGTSLESFFIMKDFNAFGFHFNTEPITTYDYFEPRSANYERYYTYPINYTVGGWYSSDYRKRFAFDVNLSYRYFDEEGRNRLNFDISPRFRFNDHLSLIYTINRQDWKNDVGYAVLNSLGQERAFQGLLDIPAGDIIFGIRDQVTYTNILNIKYTFSNKMGTTFRLRHYWSQVRYDNVYRLNEMGRLVTTPYLGRDEDGRSYHDNSYNAFTIDMVYSWVFSPGSELRLVWKNSIYTFEDNAGYRFDENLDYLWDQPQTNSLSVKFLYFIDYSTVRPAKRTGKP